MDKGLTEKMVARVLGVSVSKLRLDRRLRIGIPFVKFGRSVRYLEGDVKAVIDKARVGTQS